MSSRATNLSKLVTSSSSSRIGGSRRAVGMTMMMGVVAGGSLLTLEPRAIAFVGALAIGWSHLAGRCGMSHFGALTPRGKLAGRRLRWLSGVLAYVVSGALASAAIGAALAVGGGALVPGNYRATAVGIAILLALVAAGSDLGWIRWRLPQPSLQTRRLWGMFRSPIPEVMWGFCLGLTFATVFTFSGTWLVLSFPFVSGDPTFGAVLLLGHWLGRVAPILVGPLLLENAGHTPDFLEGIDQARDVFRISNIIGIGLMGLSLMILLRDLLA